VLACPPGFFSLLSEAISATPAQHLMDRGQALKDNNMKYNLKLFDFVRMGWSALEKNGALPFEKTRGNDGDEEFSIVSTRKEGDNIYRLLETVDDAEEKNTKNESYFRYRLPRNGSHHTAIESRQS